MLKSLAILAAAVSSVVAVPSATPATVKYDWTVGWINGNPLAPSPRGIVRPIIAINGQWPLPTVEATVGDIVEITVHNNLGNETTGIHWHGLHQIGTPHMDGAAHISQCPIPPGSSFTYKFALDQSGTYWYHSHAGSQYPDGLRGAFIVKDIVDPYAADYDKEYLITLSDWYNTEVPQLLDTVVFDPTNSPTLRPPIPDGVLFNDGKSSSYEIIPGKKYKFRIVNMSALAGVFVFFEGHDITVVEIDGVHVKKEAAELLFITPAQRYSVIIEAKSDKTKNFAIAAIFDIYPDWRQPLPPPVPLWAFNATGTLAYDAALGRALQATIPQSQLFNKIDDFTLKPLHPKTWGSTQETLEMDFTMLPIDGVGRATVNGKPYIGQKVPTLYTAMTTGQDALKPEVYGQVNPFIVGKNKIVQILLNNKGGTHHPFHFHGHHFQVCARGAPDAGVAPKDLKCDDASERDTLTIEKNSYAVLRFKSDNPGAWLFHCHIEWHVPLGLSATIIEDPLALQSGVDKVVLPADHIQACKDNCYPIKGNAGGNTVNHLDTSNYNQLQNFDDGAVFVFHECPAPNATATASVTTSTVYSTHTYTISSCAPTVTKCPYGHNGTFVTTEIVAVSTTVCPVTKVSTVRPKPTFHGPPGKPVDWPDHFEHFTYETTKVTTITSSGKAIVQTDVAKVTTAAPLTNVFPTYGTGAAPKPSATGKPVTAGAAKAATGFGAAAVAGLLAIALL